MHLVAHVLHFIETSHDIVSPRTAKEGKSMLQQDCFTPSKGSPVLQKRQRTARVVEGRFQKAASCHELNPPRFILLGDPAVGVVGHAGEGIETLKPGGGGGRTKEGVVNLPIFVFETAGV